jgi:beta-lactamase regulating signal transducer with metallopeptidase domain
MIEQINHLAQGWWDWMSAMFWQVGLLILLIAIIDLLIRRWAWPQLRYALWSLVLVKLVLSPTLSLPSGLAPKLSPVVTQMLESAAKEKPIEVTLPIKIPSAHDEFRRPVVRYCPSQPVIAESNDSFVGSISEHVAGPPGAELMPPPIETPVNTMSKHEQTDEPKPDRPLLAAQSTIDAIVPPAGPRLGWRVYAMAIWFLGVVMLSTWLFVKLRRLSKEYIDKPQQPSASAIPKRILPESFYNQLDCCAQQLNLRRKLKVVTTTRIQSPAVFGLLRPILLMPVGYIRRLSRKDTEYMLLHELAHIKRGDLIAHSLCMLIQLAYWYNPLLWLVCKQLRHLRELCCDATVASLLRDKTVEYRQTLLETARRFLATPAESGLGLVGLFEDSNRLIARINWLKKPVWRYRKMKNIAVITAVLILLACVLPMAQGQNPPAEAPNASSKQVEEKSTQSQELLTESNEEIAETENEKQNQEQLKAMQLLMARLQQLQIEKQKLEKQLQVMARAREAEAQFAQTKIMAKEAEIKAKEAEIKVKDKAAKAKALAEAQKAIAESRKAEAESRKAEVESRKAEAVAKKWEQWAKSWTNSEAFKQWQKEVEKWAIERAKVHENAKEGIAFPTPAPHPNPHPMPVMPPMPPMPLEIEVETEIEVEPEVQVDVEVEVLDVPEVPEAVVPVPPTPPTVVPTPPEPPTVVVPTPPVPPAPPSAVAHASSAPPIAVPTPPKPPKIVEPTPPAPPRAVAPVEAITPAAPPAATSLPLLGTTAATVEPAAAAPKPKPSPKPDRDVKISKNKDGKYVATTEMHFISKVKPGIPFVIRNNLGNITLRPSKDNTCDVKAEIRAEAKTADKAKEMVERVGMKIDSSDDRYYLKPVKPDDDQWSNLNVDLTLTVPPGVRPDIKTDLGNIELYDLKGNIKALTDLGSLKVVNTTGNINLATDLGGIKFTAPKDLAAGDLNLATKMGDIEFIAPRDMSATIRAETKMGSIKSDLPLKVTEIDMFKRKAEGTMGTGKGNIRLHTDMGSIRLKWQPSPGVVPTPKPLPSDAEKL